MLELYITFGFTFPLGAMIFMSIVGTDEDNPFHFMENASIAQKVCLALIFLPATIVFLSGRFCFRLIGVIWNFLGKIG